MSKFTYTVRKDGRLMKKVTVKGKPIYLYSTDKDDLERQYIDTLYKKNNGITIEDNSVTFKKYAELWFDRNCKIKATATQISIKNRINHLNNYIAYVKLKDLKPYHVQTILSGMIEEGYTDITRRTISELRRILNDAILNDVIQKNVAQHIKLPKFQKNDRKPLTIAEDKKVYSLALTHKYGLFILLLRFCGLRPEEAVALEITDLDIENKKIYINKAMSLAKNQPEEKPTKNLKNRYVPIPDFLLEKLKEKIEHCKSNNTKYLFTKETNKEKPLTKQALRSHLDSFLYQLNKNLPDDDKIHFTYYQLRHSYCTMLYYSGVKIKKAQELMGHSSADMVYNIYTHLDEERENAEELINDYVNCNILQEKNKKKKAIKLSEKLSKIKSKARFH